MLTAIKSTSTLGNDLELRYAKALAFFRERSPVIFLNQHYRYWESHGFVQQSLAKCLVDAGVHVVWLDGAAWKKQSIVQNWDSPLLTVSNLPQLPLRRFDWMAKRNPNFQTRAINKYLALGKKPLLWVQSGIEEATAEKLPYIDVFSVFDDPYLHSPSGTLSQKANLILTQNSYAKDLFAKAHPHKTLLALPPVDMTESHFDDHSDFELPPCFPEKVMGYIGSFLNDGFDLVLFEDFLKSFPDWGFILLGRTDSEGRKRIAQWSGYRNFLHLEWVPREKVGSVWRCLDVNLLLYRPHPAADGAFPVKVLEALHYGVPSVATRVPKTSSLEAYVPRLLFPEHLKAQAVKAGMIASGNALVARQHFMAEMNPKLHLIRVAEKLKHSAT